MQVLIATISCVCVIGLSTAALAELPKLDLSRAGNYCTDQWTKRGNLDRKMYSYCMERQEDGYLDALSLKRKYGNVPDIDKIANYAVRKWLKAREYQYEMVAYEMEQQIDAFLNIAYDVKAGTFKESEVLPCIAKWHTDEEPQWNMIEYCLKN